mmetsp:Transcript_78155/g.208952  ORF Transcript_78155/g.208952 Transcript_78155/m.208952 type:complete len:358 (+) Transcript_78155:47-1120(+)
MGDWEEQTRNIMAEKADVLQQLVNDCSRQYEVRNTFLEVRATPVEVRPFASVPVAVNLDFDFDCCGKPEEEEEDEEASGSSTTADRVCHGADTEAGSSDRHWFAFESELECNPVHHVSQSFPSSAWPLQPFSPSPWPAHDACTSPSPIVPPRNSSRTGASTSPQLVELLATVEAAALEHLRLEPTGRMNLATLGNRIPQQLSASLKEHGIRFARFVRTLSSVTVHGTTVQITGAAPKEALPARHLRRGEFLEALRARTVSEPLLHEVFAVLQCVHQLLVTSTRQSESPCALGNKLAPQCRTFLNQHRVRLIELLNEFSCVFAPKNSPVSQGSTPHIELADPHAPLTLDIMAPYWPRW